MNIRVVAVARPVGTAGEEIAQLTAEKLGFRFYDYQVVQTAAQEAGVSPETVSEAEHTPSLLTRILEALARNPSMPVAAWADPVPLATNPLLTSTEYRRFIEDVIRDLADQGEAVLIGHGAPMVLQGRSDTLKVLTTGSTEQRAQRIADGMNVNVESARRTVEKTDSERQDYFRRFYNRAWLATENYDLCLNTDRLTPDQAATLIAQTAQMH